MENKIFEKVSNIIYDTLECGIDEKNRTNDLIKLGMTSLTFVRILVEIENEFNFEFDDDAFDLEKFVYIEDFVIYIENKINV